MTKSKKKKKKSRECLVSADTLRWLVIVRWGIPAFSLEVPVKMPLFFCWVSTRSESIPQKNVLPRPAGDDGFSLTLLFCLRAREWYCTSDCCSFCNVEQC